MKQVFTTEHPIKRAKLVIRLKSDLRRHRRILFSLVVAVDITFTERLLAQGGNQIQLQHDVAA